MNKLERGKALYSEGVNAFRQGNRRVAENRLKAALDILPDALPILLALATVQMHGQQIAEAQKLLQKATTLYPKSLEAWLRLGCVYTQRSQPGKALACFNTAVDIDPLNREAWYNRAVTFQMLQQHDQAVASFDQSLQRGANDAECWSVRATSLRYLRRYDEALASDDRALSIRSDYAAAWSNRGLTLLAMKRLEPALASCDKALALDGAFAEAWSNRGLILHALERYEQALDAYDTAVKLRPDYADAYSNRCLSLRGLQRLDDALASSARALKLNPDAAEIWLNHGGILHDLKRFDEALAAYARALALQPGLEKAWLNQGVTLNELLHYERALASFDQAEKLDPQDAEIRYNRGVTLQRLKRYDEAMACYEQALAFRADDAEAVFNQSMIHLLRGEFQSGWKKYEARWQATGNHKYRHQDLPLLEDLSAIDNKTVLIWSEQGFGDVIQFVRYLPLLKNRGARVIFEVPPALEGVLGAMPCCQVILSGEACPPADWQLPLMSLPLLFKTDLASIPAPLPKDFLRIDPALVLQWKQRLALTGDKPTIGFACSGNASHRNDAVRSMPLEWCAPLLPLANLVLLQKEVRDADQAFLQQHDAIRFVGADLQTFSDTAAVIENVDLVISVDTSLVHLAGSMGKPLYVLLPWAGEWRWLMDRSDSPWYPGARLCRQSAPGDWAGVMAEVCERLKTL
jgi:tetratricopeptide (TPR) repeat protein